METYWFGIMEFSDETERLMDHAVRDLVGHAFDRAIEILNVHQPVHEKTALLLLQKETDLAALRAQIVPAGVTEATLDGPATAAAGI